MDALNSGNRPVLYLDLLLFDFNSPLTLFQSTESDLSWDSDELSVNSKVSLDEFNAQYQELTDWLQQIQQLTLKQGGSSLSEKYLNQVRMWQLRMAGD